MRYNQHFNWRIEVFSEMTLFGIIPSKSVLLNHHELVQYRKVGTNSSGLVGNVGRSFNGSPNILPIIRNLEGKLEIIGLVLSATGLYFLPAQMEIDWL